jgi:hypothetical protein
MDDSKLNKGKRFTLLKCILTRVINTMQITETETKFLNELVKDCITYGLEEKEAMQYLEVRFKPV